MGLGLPDGGHLIHGYYVYLPFYAPFLDPSFKLYAKQVIANARVLGEELVKHGYKLQTGGTANHLILWDLRPLGLTGSKVEKVCDLLGITINSMSFYIVIL
jgi:glycine/serine hydroxymethyltransferase